MSFSRNEIDTMSGTRKKKKNLPIIGDNGIATFEQGCYLPYQSLQHMLVFQGQRRIAIFPTQSDLISATVDASLAPIIAWQPLQKIIHNSVLLRCSILLIHKCLNMKGRCVAHCRFHYSSGLKSDNQANIQKNDLFVVIVKRSCQSHRTIKKRIIHKKCGIK